MDTSALGPVIERLSAWRDEAVGRLRRDGSEAPGLKLALDAAILWLRIAEGSGMAAPDEAVPLPEPGGFAPLGEYRILWDVEAEDRSRWREVLRALPGDLLVRRR